MPGKKNKVLISPNDGQSFNPADYTTYDALNAPKNDFRESGNISGYNYERDSSVDAPTITPYDLPSLNDTRAENQGILSSLGDSTAKFVGKTALNIVGGVAGTIYGIGSSIANGDIKKLWDNSFSTKVDDIDKGLDDIFKVYKSSDYLQQNILQRAFLHPTKFIDDTADALSFTAGAILTELATAGVGTEFLVPKALKYMKFLSRGAEAAEATAEITSLGQNILRKAGTTGRLVRQLATGASYEAMVETRQSTMALRDKMYQDYQKEHPNEEMPESVKADIDDRLSKAGMFSYITNLALVGSTNMAQFPKIFGLGYNTSRVAAGAITRDIETGLFSSTAKSFKDMSLLGKAGVILKNSYEEGIKEEGLQNVISHTVQDYWDRKNSPDDKHTVNSFLETVGKNIANTYTSKEGWNDIGMGMIIGSLGAPGRGVLAIAGKDNAIGKRGYDNITDEQGNIIDQKRAPIWTGGAAGSIQEHNSEVAHIQDVVDGLNKHTDLFKAMQANYDFLVQSTSLEKDKEKALKDNDVFTFNNAKDDQIHSYVSARIKAGMYQDVLDTIDNMKKMSPEEFYTQFRGEEAANNTTSVDQTRFQQESIKEFTDKAENTNEAIKIADSIYRGDNEDLKEQLVHSIAASKNLDVRENAMNQSLADLSGGLISNMGLVSTSTDTIGERIKQSEALLKSKNISEEDKTALTNDIANYKKAVKLDITPEEHDMLINLAKTNPTAFNLNRNKIFDLLKDSRRLREQRQNYLDLYNHLYTEKGQQDFEDSQRRVVAEQVKQQQEEAKKQQDEDAEKQKKKNIKETVKKSQSQNIENNTINTGQYDETIQNEDIPNVNISEEDLEDTPEVSTPKPVENNTVEEIPEVPEPTVAENPSNYNELEVGDKVKNGNKEGTITEKKDGKVTVEFDNGGKLETSPSFTDLHKVETGLVTTNKTQLEPEETAVVAIENNKDLQANRQLILVENQLLKNPTEEQFKRIGQIEKENTDLQRIIGNTITYLAIDKILFMKVRDGQVTTSTFDTFDNEGNIEINTHFNPKLLSQNYFKIGDKANLKVPSFSQMEERGLQDYSLSDYMNNLDSIEEFPIAFFNSEGKIDGYLPTQSNIRDTVPIEHREQALRDNLNLRTTIFNDNLAYTYSTTITSRTPGFLIKDLVTNQKSLFKALGNGKDKLADKVKLGVVKPLVKGIEATANDLYIDNSKEGIFKDGEIINPKVLQSGLLYSILPTSVANKYVAYPMKVNKIGEDNAKTIVEAIRLFAKKNLNYTFTDEDNKSVSNINEYSINNFDDLLKFVNSIMYATNKTSAEDTSTFALHSGSLFLSKFGQDKFKLNDIVNSESTRQQIVDILQDRYYSIALENINNKEGYISYSLDENNIMKETEHPNYQSYLDTNNIVTSNVRGVHIEGNEYAFTAQSVIGISNDISKDVKALPKKIEEEPTDAQIEEESVAKEEPITNNSKEEVTWNNLIKVGNTIKIDLGTNDYSGNITITSVKNLDTQNRTRVDYTKPNGGEGFFFMPYSEQEDSFILYQNGKGSNTENIVEKKTKKTLFDPKKIKTPPKLDDISPEYIEKQSVKSGEDLMRKCL